MSKNDIKRLVAEAIQERGNQPLRKISASGTSGKTKKHMQFSKKLMVFSCLIYAGTWGVAVASWFLTQEYPEGLKTMATWLLGATFAFYEIKSCVENKANIEAKAKVEMAELACSDGGGNFDYNDFSHGTDECFSDFR